MRTFLLPILLSLFTYVGIAQSNQTFDIITFSPPKGWGKKNSENAVQFTTQEAAKGTYCIITLMKSVPGTDNSKQNFNTTWQKAVKETMNVSTAPEMQAPTKENGWNVESGYAPFESDGTNGIAMLITSSGFEKMVNILVLTNTTDYEKDVTSFLESISLPKQVTKITTSNISANTKPTKSSGFKFTTTNFDDGWVATEQPDWVSVTKENINVLVHYPNKKADAYNSVVMDGLKNAWNILVAPKYSAASNMEFKPITGWQTIEFAEADMTDNNSRQKVHVVLFKMNYSNGSGKYLEFITNDKQSFENEFGPYHQTTSGWEKLENMVYYNRFAVAASDLQGKWTSDFSGAIQYVNANTGLDAGMDTHASVENFQFGAGNTYKWDIGVASGPVGNIKFTSKNSNGKFSLPNNWQVYFSDLSGKPRTFTAYFSCIKGLRILWLDNKPYAKSN